MSDALASCMDLSPWLSPGQSAVVFQFHADTVIAYVMSQLTHQVQHGTGGGVCDCLYNAVI